MKLNIFDVWLQKAMWYKNYIWQKLNQITTKPLKKELSTAVRMFGSQEPAGLQQQKRSKAMGML